VSCVVGRERNLLAASDIGARMLFGSEAVTRWFKGCMAIGSVTKASSVAEWKAAAAFCKLLSSPRDSSDDRQTVSDEMLEPEWTFMTGSDVVNGVIVFDISRLCEVDISLVELNDSVELVSGVRSMTWTVSIAMSVSGSVIDG
jgi:hypothetical protein